MPNRERVESQAAKKNKKFSHLDNFRSILQERYSNRKGNVAELARKVKMHPSQLRETIAGDRRFNEDSFNAIAEVEQIPIWVGSVPPVPITVQRSPFTEKALTAEFMPIRIVTPTTIAEKPLHITQEDVIDWSYVPKKTLQGIGPNYLIATRINLRGQQQSLVGSEMIVCITTDVKVKADNINPNFVWLVRVDGYPHIGKIENVNGVLALRQEAPLERKWIPIQLEDVIGRVVFFAFALI